MNDFEREVAARLAANGQNTALNTGAREFLRPSVDAKYS